MSSTKKSAILIGINNIPGMSYLSSPCRYATAMQVWAAGQGYDTHLFVDEPDNGPTKDITLNMIYSAVEQFLKQDTEQLIIYFAGHGIEWETGNDVWLLPGCMSNPNEAINISNNRNYAQQAGLRHIIFISDACRSAPPHGMTFTNGSFIFPSQKRQNYNTTVDVLYSTWPGQISTDYRNAKGEYVSVYSDALLDCLNGHVAEVIRDLTKISPTFPAVVPDDLELHLKEKVPELAALVGIDQHPMGIVSSRDPVFLSKFNNSIYLKDDENSEFLRREPRDDKDNFEKRLDYFININFRLLPRRYHVRQLADLTDDLDVFSAGGLFPNNTTGFYINGISRPAIFSYPSLSQISEGSSDQGRRLRFWSSDFFPNRSGVQQEVNIVVEGPYQHYYPITLLKNHICVIEFKNGTLSFINYYPTSTGKPNEINESGKELSKQKARIIYGARNGIFQDTENKGEFTKKDIDPILGLFKAYAFFQKGDYEFVRSLISFISSYDEPLLADLILLFQLVTGEKLYSPSGNHQLPILTAGWSYMDLLPANEYKELSKYLQPGLWTSFNRKGMEILETEYKFKPVL